MFRYHYHTHSRGGGGCSMAFALILMMYALVTLPWLIVPTVGILVLGLWLKKREENKQLHVVSAPPPTPQSQLLCVRCKDWPPTMQQWCRSQNHSA